ncbi:HmuY family protein [Patiriisocius sp. Uisw_047]|uniref:HmuY family protein n=1 Tax=Patiriisocius sp. Uisw_047 TaxID=3230969 RepID=UPI0039EAD841
MSEPFVAAFESLSANLGEIETTQDISLVYSETTTTTGSMKFSIDAINAVYGIDFITNPPLEEGVVSLAINPEENGTAFSFVKLNGALDETVEINFNILMVDYPNAVIQGNSTFTLNSAASLGRGFIPMVGGPNQQNQVYIDLSTETQSPIKRDTWDLGFYGGSNFRVGINGSIYMAAAALESTNIDAVTQADVSALQAQVAVGTFDPANEVYIDNPDGDITKTAIATVSATAADNKVYLVNLGYEVGTETPAPGSAAVAGDERGWKKIRVLRQEGGYLLQYANINDSSHQEVFIAKDINYNFTFFSFDTNNTLLVEPEAENWDINFTVFTNVLDGAGSYGFSDGALHNRKGGVTAYTVNTEDVAYDAFDATNVNNGAFLLDQRTIGSSWRNVINADKVIIDTIFYIIKDPNGNFYKLKFTALLSDTGVRGFPEFKYNLL